MPALTEGRRRLLNRRAQSLLARIPDRTHPVEARESPTAAELAPIYDDIDRKIQRFFIAAMLCSVHEDPVVDHLGMHVLDAALKAVRTGRLVGVAEEACRHIRLMRGGTRAALLERIAPLGLRPTEAVLQWLDEQRQTLKETGTVRNEHKSLDEQLTNLSSPLNYLVTGEYTTRSLESDPARTAHRTQSYAEPEVASTKEVRFSNQTAEGVDTNHALIDVKPGGEPHHQQSLPAQRHRARVARSQIVRGYMMSPSRWGILSTHSLDGLAEELYRGLNAGNKVDAFLLMSLLTGRSIIGLADLVRTRAEARARFETEQRAIRNVERPRLSFDGLGLYLRVGLKLPRLKVDPDHRRFYAPSAEVLALPLPDEIDACLKRGDPLDRVMRVHVIERLASLNARFPQVTEARIRSAGRLWLYHHGEDRTTLDRLFGTDLAHAVPLYYENMRVSNVLNAYRKWVGRLNKAMGGDAL
ncbi:MAG: hypothetical protein OXC14_10430, partial [Rhodospirillaceae bacterium]|nr:hypothetical protein [Rhodospirillaceae bacterium]